MAKPNVEIRSAYGSYAPHRGTDVSGESRTHQSFQVESEINNIMAKYSRTGLIDHVNRYQGRYGDFTEGVADFHTAMNIVTSAKQAFESLPANMRARFGNDPGAFVDFVSDPDNVDQMRTMGLLPKEADALAEPGAEPAEPTPAEPASTAEGGEGSG